MYSYILAFTIFYILFFFRFAGEFGAYQRILFIMLAIFSIFIYYAQLFIVITPTEYWCKLPEVEKITAERLKELLIPSSKKVPYEGHYLPYSRCWIYDVPIETVIAAEKPDDDWPMKKCYKWEFKFSRRDVPFASVAVEQKWVINGNASWEISFSSLRYNAKRRKEKGIFALDETTRS